MKPIALVLAALLAGSMPALASDDPIETRQALMDSNAGAAGLAAGVMKGEIAYSPAIGKAAILTTAAVATAVGDYFPEGSAEGDTDAAPKIWEDPEGFAATLAKFQKATAAAVEAAGEKGPADAEAFTAAINPVLDVCKECHETYRLED